MCNHEREGVSMALGDKQKDKIRRYIRLVMVFIAVLLLLFSTVIPVTNNAIALRVENQLKQMPLPKDAQLVASVSAAGDLTDIHPGMQYYGAILIQSSLSVEQITDHYAQCCCDEMDCIVLDSAQARAFLGGMSLGKIEPEFDADGIHEDWYLVYSWGSPPNWLKDILNLDSRG